jgi:hypothetical protein
VDGSTVNTVGSALNTDTGSGVCRSAEDRERVQSTVPTISWTTILPLMLTLKFWTVPTLVEVVQLSDRSAQAITSGSGGTSQSHVDEYNDEIEAMKPTKRWSRSTFIESVEQFQANEERLGNAPNVSQSCPPRTARSTVPVTRRKGS